MHKTFLTIVLCVVIAIAGSHAPGQTPERQSGQSLPTTGTIESRIEPLTFEGGYPTNSTVAKLYDEMNFQRAAEITGQSPPTDQRLAILHTRRIP